MHRVMRKQYTVFIKLVIRQSIQNVDVYLQEKNHVQDYKKQSKYLLEK